MFSSFSRSFFRHAQVLTTVSLIILGSVSEAFVLDSKTLEEKTDYFSKLKPDKKYKEVDRLISVCSSSRAQNCLSTAQTVYIDPHFVFFRNLVSELSVKHVINKRLPIEKLSFLNRSEIKESEVSRILKHFDYDEIIGFFGKDFLILNPEVRKSVLEHTNLLCKFSEDKVFVELMLTSIVGSDDYYQKDYSAFPCTLDLTGKMDLLLSELKKSKSKNYDQHKYYFDFIRSRVAKKAYRAFPFYRTLPTAQRKKRLWTKIFEAQDYVQEKVVQNLFYRGEYELLAHLATYEIEEVRKLSTDVLEYPVKSLVALGEYEDVIKLTDHVSSSPNKSVEETLLMRGNAFLRLKKNEKAEKAYRALLLNPVDLKLSGLYWLRTALKLQGKDEEVIRPVDDQILDSYPFSYYGILVADERYGDNFFERYKDENFIKQSFVGAIGPGALERLKFYYSYGYQRYFKKAFNGVEERLNPQQKALFAMVFRNLGDQLEVIRSLNLAWDLDSDVRAEPFISASFPTPYKSELNHSLKKTNYLDEASIYAVMRQESAFGVVARSPSGARGLMQLLPTTARDVARQTRYKAYKRARDLYDPKVNIMLGSKYMDRLIRAGKGYLPYAFASYNAGPGRMYRWSKYRTEITDLRQGLKKEGYNPIDELWVEELPWSETRFYTKALLRNMGIYLALTGNQEKFQCTPYWACDEKNL